MKQKIIYTHMLGGDLMKRNYEEPIVEKISFNETDIITASPSQGDNVIDDSYFD